MQSVTHFKTKDRGHQSALAFNKAELTALLTAAGSKKTRVDERVLWVDWHNSLVICQDMTVLVALCYANTETKRDPHCSTILVEDIKDALKEAKAKDTVILAPAAEKTYIYVFEGSHELEDHFFLDASLKSVLACEDQETSMNFEQVVGIIPKLDLDPSIDRAGHFEFDSRYFKVMEKVAAASGKGPSIALLPPLEGGPFHVRVASNMLDKSNYFDVVAMPLSPS